MKYTADQMQQFLSVFLDGKYGNLDHFVRKMKEFGLSEEESTIMWQSFDTAGEYYYDDYPS